MKKYTVRLTFTSELLGTISKDKDVYTKFIQKNILDNNGSDELDTIEDVSTIGTGFHMLEGNPLIYDYVIKGFFKDACSMLRRASDTASSKLPSFKKVIDGLVFPLPRRILIDTHGSDLGNLERPLRAQTAKGERVALAKSDTCPIGSTLDFELRILGGVTEKLLKEWLDYGSLRGLGQWRNAGYGTFDYTLKKL